MSDRAKRYDLTQGPILQKLLQVAMPIMGSQLMLMSYNLTDMFWLGRVGSDAVAASGTAGMYMWLSMAFMMIGRMGAEIGVSQSMGRGDEDAAKQYAQTSALIAVLLGVGYGLLLILLRVQLVGFFNIQDVQVARMTESYLAIVSIAMPLDFVLSALVGMFNASGNSRTPFLVNAVGLLLNIVLDPLMIFVFGWGMEGAAIATVLAKVASCVLILFAARRGKHRPFERFRIFIRPLWETVGQIFRWGIPIGLESALFTGMAMITSRLVASFGTSAMAVSRVGSQIESLTWLVGGGYGSAMTAFVGQNYGAGKWTRIRKGFSLSERAMFLYGLFVTALVFFFGGFLFSVFLPDEEIIRMGATYLRIIAICQIPQCFEAIAASTFKGIGRTTPPAIVSVCANIVRVLLSYALSRVMGLNGVWWGIALAAVLRGMWGYVWLRVASKKMPREDAPAVQA